MLPVWPMLTDPEPIRINCLEEYREQLERYLACQALTAANRWLMAGDIKTAHGLIEKFPLSKNCRYRYLKFKLKLLCPGLVQVLRKFKHRPIYTTDS